MSKDIHFSAKEYADRVAALRHRMETAGVEACLLDEIEAMTWISGYGSSLNRWRCVVVPLDAEPFFLIRALDATPCRQRTWIKDIPTYRDWEDPMPVLAAALAKRGLSKATLGLDFNSYAMSLGRFGSLRNALPDARIVDIGPVVNELRLIKSPQRSPCCAVHPPWRTSRCSERQQSASPAPPSGTPRAWRSRPTWNSVPTRVRPDRSLPEPAGTSFTDTSATHRCPQAMSCTSS
jgi:hypothetical protein